MADPNFRIFRIFRSRFSAREVGGTPWVRQQNPGQMGVIID